MEKLRKIFGGYEMTWKRLIIFSIICGAYTAAVLLIPGVNETALREIGVGYECWFLLAIFVVSNCKNGKEAAIKCFVFFLISQPLVYIIQMPFSEINLLATYYKFWFILTLFTLPGGFIAYQITRNDLLGSIILALAGGSVGFFGLGFFVQGLKPLAVSYIIYGIFLFASAIILGYIFCGKKKDRVIYLLITIILSIVLLFTIGNTGLNSKDYETELPEGDWMISSGMFDKMEVNVEGGSLKITYHGKKATGQFTLTNENEESINYTARIEDGELVLVEE